MTQAAAMMERQEDATAMLLLEEAIIAAREPSPAFAAQLLGQLAGGCRARPEPVFLKMPLAKGCSTTTSALRTSVEEAIREQVPEIEKIEVVPSEPPVEVEARTITCPWHGFRFDCISGDCLTVPQVQLAIYPVQIKDGFVWVKPA